MVDSESILSDYTSTANPPGSQPHPSPFTIGTCNAPNHERETQLIEILAKASSPRGCYKQTCSHSSAMDTVAQWLEME